MSCFGDTGSPMHRHTYIVVPAKNAFACMQSHAYPYRPPGRPGVLSQGSLSPSARPQRLYRAGKYEEEAIPALSNLYSPLSGNHLPEQLGMRCEDLEVGCAQSLHKPGGAFNVGKQKGNRAGRKSTHVFTP